MTNEEGKVEEHKIIVNSWNEWDPLKHIVVGVADGCVIPPSEPASECKIPIGSIISLTLCASGEYGSTDRRLSISTSLLRRRTGSN